MSSSHLKNNGARISRLIIDQGTETLRLYFDSKIPPPTLTGVLHHNYPKIKKTRAINQKQLEILYPPSGVLPSSSTTKSSDYDITLLFILIRNICGLTAPTSTGSWDSKPPPHDISEEADLARIKYYRNDLYGHKKCTDVSDADFNTYWSEISAAFVRLSLGLGVDPRVNIACLKTGLLDEDFFINKLNEWYEYDRKVELLLRGIGENVHKNEVLLRENLEQTRIVNENLNKNEALVLENVEQTKIVGENVCQNKILALNILQQATSVGENVNKNINLAFKSVEQTKSVEEKVNRNEVLGLQNLQQIKKIVKTVENIKSIVAILIGVIIVCCFIACCFYRYSLNKFKYHSYPLNFSNPNFVGRGWIFQMFEHILNLSHVRGVLLVTEQGWGKSATIKQLIHSPTSSAVIHNNIIGHYFCKYNRKTTRDGEQFVKELVLFISEKIPKFREIVNNDQLTMHELHNCKKEPMECFQKVIVNPLRKLNDAGRNVSFIVIDALDECLDKKERHHSIILNMLYNSVPDLPNWVKLIVTSRNQPQSTGKMKRIGIFTLEVDAQDHRNEVDLRTYANQTLQKFFSEVLKPEEQLQTNDLIDLALKFSKGNFLFLKTILNFWQKYPHKINTQTLPDDIENIYTKSFANRFTEGDLHDFEPLFEVLLAARSPPKLFELDKILNYHYKNYNTRKTADKLSEYLKPDFNQEPIEFYHQFFAEWLNNQTSNVDGIVIQKSRGHQYIVEYLFHFYTERQTSLTFEELSELCTHILQGEKETVPNVKRLSSFNVSEVQDSRKRNILHDLASKRDATKIINVLINQFNHVDIVNDNEWTPAMYAVRADAYENLDKFIDNAANANYLIKRTFCFLGDFLALRSSYENNASMSFVAAYKGYTKIAKLLVKTLVRSRVNIENVDECGWKPLYAAAVMGHFEIVELYINNGAQADVISLHHAAARNRSLSYQSIAYRYRINR